MRMWICFFSLASWFTHSGCSTPRVVATDAGTEHSDGPDAFVGRDLECPEPCVIRWREVTPYDVPVDSHNLYIVQRDDGEYLYLLGGGVSETDGQSYVTYNRRVSAAKVLPNGDLGPWQHTATPANGAIVGAARVLMHLEDAVYFGFAGGAAPDEDLMLQPVDLAAVLRIPVGEGAGLDSVGPQFLQWGQRTGRALNAIATGVIFAGDTGDSARLHLIGGVGQTTSDAVLYSTTADTNPWVPSANLPQPRFGHVVAYASFVDPDNNNFYVVGGMTGVPPSSEFRTNVLRTRLNGADIIGWDEVGTSPAMVGGTAFVTEGFLYMLGGATVEQGRETLTDRIVRAPVYPNGSLGPFVAVGRLPVPLAPGQMPFSDGRVYICGGRQVDGNGFSSSSRCFVGTILDFGVPVDGGLGASDASLDGSDVGSDGGLDQ